MRRALWLPIPAAGVALAAAQTLPLLAFAFYLFVITSIVFIFCKGVRNIMLRNTFFESLFQMMITAVSVAVFVRFINVIIVMVILYCLYYNDFN